MTWTPQDDASLCALCRTHTAEEIARKLKRSIASIECRRKRLGLTKPRANKREPAPEKLERLACDPTADEISAITNEIRRAAGLPAVVWPALEDVA